MEFCVRTVGLRQASKPGYAQRFLAFQRSHAAEMARVPPVDSIITSVTTPPIIIIPIEPSELDIWVDIVGALRSDADSIVGFAGRRFSVASAPVRGDGSFEVRSITHGAENMPTAKRKITISLTKTSIGDGIQSRPS